LPTANPQHPTFSMPFFSILVPTYEQPALINRCIQGILEQNFGDFELVISDDSRDDETRNRVATYSDPRIRYIKNTPSLGRVSNYRQLVLQHAKGEWLLICDGDDYLTDSGYLSEIYSLIQQNPHLVWLQAGHVKGNSLEEGVLEVPLIANGHQIMSGRDYLLEYPQIAHFSHLSTVSKAALMNQIDSFRLNILSADMETYFRMAAHGDICLIRKSVGLWYQHGKNASATQQLAPYFRNLQWIPSIFDYWKQQFPELKTELEKIKNQRLKDTFFYEMKQRLLKNQPSFSRIIEFLKIVFSHSFIRNIALTEIRFYRMMLQAVIRK
jgi:glycosyltransferase involved in cell wall biosynthesis